MEELFRDNNIFYNILCLLITENEKFFDRSDARLYWKTVFHIFGLIHHAYIGIFAISLDLDGSTKVEIKTLKQFRAGYLTGWNFILQSAYLTLSLYHDFLEWFDKHEGKLGKKIRYWRDVVFCGLVVPNTSFVTSMFWALYAIDRELVFPAVYDEIVPWWFNHCVHTNIFVVMVVEMLLQPRRKPTDFKVETICYATISVLYAVVFYSIFFFANRWLYKIFAIMTWWQICLYQLAIWGSTHVFYRMQYPIARLIHGPEPESIESNKVVTTTEDVHKSDNTEEKGSSSNGVSAEETNGVKNGFKPLIKNETLKSPTQLNSPPFTDKSWSLKYRNVRSQFENGKL